MNGARFRRLLVAVHRGIGRRQQFADRAMPHRIVLLLANAMVDLITASRAYEANLSVAKNARQMALKTLQIGK